MLTEDSISAGSLNLISINHLRLMTVMAAIDHCLSFEVFSLVVGVVAQGIEEGESLAGDRD